MYIFLICRIFFYSHCTCIYTYIIGQYNIYIRVLILSMSSGTYSLKLSPEYRFLRNLSWQFYFALNVLARNLQREKVEEEIFKFRFVRNV